jgi:MOSC domain-containing protein YiiM
MDEIRPGLQQELQGKRGVLARAITDGQISVGDKLEVSLS